MNEPAVEASPNLLDLALLIPDTVIAAITAALITLLGVHLQNRANFKLLREQLKQDKEEKSTQRKLELRRDVYLKAEKDIADMQTFLAELPKYAKKGTVSLEPLNRFSITSGQVQLISETETAEVAGELVTQLGEAYFEAVKRLLPAIRLNSEAQAAQESLDLANSESKRLFLEICSWHEKPQQNQEDYDHLNKSFEFWNEELQKHAQKRNDIETSRLHLDLEHSEWMVTILEETREKTTRLKSLLRKELEFESTESHFQEQAENNAKILTSKLKELNQALKEEIAKAQND